MTDTRLVSEPFPCPICLSGLGTWLRIAQSSRLLPYQTVFLRCQCYVSTNTLVLEAPELSSVLFTNFINKLGVSRNLSILPYFLRLGGYILVRVPLFSYSGISNNRNSSHLLQTSIEISFICVVRLTDRWIESECLPRHHTCPMTHHTHPM